MNNIDIKYEIGTVLKGGKVIGYIAKRRKVLGYRPMDDENNSWCITRKMAKLVIWTGCFYTKTEAINKLIELEENNE